MRGPGTLARVSLSLSLGIKGIKGRVGWVSRRSLIHTREACMGGVDYYPQRLRGEASPSSVITSGRFLRASVKALSLVFQTVAHQAVLS